MKNFIPDLNFYLLNDEWFSLFLCVILNHSYYSLWLAFFLLIYKCTLFIKNVSFFSCVL